MAEPNPAEAGTTPSPPPRHLDPVGLLPDHGAEVSAVGFLSGIGDRPGLGGTLLAVGGGHKVVVWEVTDPARPHTAAVLNVAAGAVTAMAVGAGGGSLAVGCDDQTVTLYDLEDPARPVQAAVLPVPCHRWQEPAAAVAFSRDGRLLVTADREATVWDVSRRHDPVRAGTLKMPRRWRRGTRCAVAFGPDRRLAVGARGTLALWDLADPAAAVRSGMVRPFGHAIGVNAIGVRAVAFTPDGRLLATATGQRIEAYTGSALIASDQNAVDLWDLSEPFQPRRTARLLQRGESRPRPRHRDNSRSGQEAPVRGVAFSPDGRHVATASEDGTALVWELTSPDHPRPVALFQHRAAVTAVAFSPDGQLLVTGCADSRVALWDSPVAV